MTSAFRQDPGCLQEMRLDKDQVFSRAREILKIEADGIITAARSIGKDFAELACGLASLKGKVLVSGVGKSGIVAEKLAATFSSTGTPAFYMNPINALHGDLGVVRDGDMLLVVSNSGETEEIIHLIEAVKGLGVGTAAITAKADSTIAGICDFVLDSCVEREACPLGLAPTTSTTVSMALGDALAMVVMEMRGFRPEDFARYHPGGALRRRLNLLVRDIMRSGDLLPAVAESASLEDALNEMTVKETLGVVLVTGGAGELLGILTDGDLRRILLRAGDSPGLMNRKITDFMTKKPKTIEADAVAAEALRIMEMKGISSLAIVDQRSRPLGIIHLHDILGRGSFSI